MNEYTIGEPFSVCFNIMKIKYRDYDEILTSSNFLKSDDKVNVFINLESLFKNLSMVQDLERKILLEKDFNNIIVSNMLNHAAHYKYFFRNNGLDTKVYLYNTSLDTVEYQQEKYNSEFRSYYRLKYLENPKFILFGDKLKDDILPNLNTISQFIPNIYYISAKDIEGSLVPLIIANDDLDRKNIIITGDLYETQYTFKENFLVTYIKTGIKGKGIYVDLKGFLKEFIKNCNNEVIQDLLYTFNSLPFYTSFLSCNGDRMRSIDGISGVGLKTLRKMIDDGINNLILKPTSSNVEIISKVFSNDELKEEFINNYFCTNIDEMYKELRDIDKDTIKNQIIDRIDINSLKMINGSNFMNHPLNLEALTC